MTQERISTESEEQSPGEYSTAPPWSPAVVRIWAVVLGIALVVFVIALRPIWPLAGGALLLAYIVSPLVDWLQYWAFNGKRRGLAVSIVLLLFMIALVLLLLLVVPTLLSQIVSGIDAAVRFIEEESTQPLTIGGEPWTNAEGEPIILNDVVTQFLENNDLESITADVWEELGLSVSALRSFAFGSFRLVQSLAQSVVSTSLGVLLFSFIVFYLLHDGHNIFKNMVRLAPDGYQEDLSRLLTDLGQVWNDYLRGQLILSIIMGTSMWLIATALGLPQPLIFGMIAAFMEFIPNIGPTIALVPPAITGLLVTSSTMPELSGIPIALLVVALWFIMQQLEALVLVPTIVGGSLHLHPVVMILAVIWGASFGGIIGVIIAGPIIASLRILGHYLYGRLTGRTSFAPPEVQESPFLQKASNWIANWRTKQKRTDKPLS